jgi:hypothetical protein
MWQGWGRQVMQVEFLWVNIFRSVLLDTEIKFEDDVKVYVR